MSRRKPLPDKRFFKIGEVAEVVGVKPHVLRYWEQEFPQLRPKKTRGSHRQFSREDLDVAMEIRRLLHDDGYTLPGARKRLQQLRKLTGVRGAVTDGARRELALRAELLGLRQELTGFLADLHRLTATEQEAAQLPNAKRVAAQGASVRVDAVVPTSRTRHHNK